MDARPDSQKYQILKYISVLFFVTKFLKYNMTFLRTIKAEIKFSGSILKKNMGVIF